MSKTKQDVARIVTDRIIEALEQGVAPWARPWKRVGGRGPTSLATGKPYRGINTLILETTAMLEGYSSPYWVTYNQAKARAVEAAQAEGRTLVEKTGKTGRKYWVEVTDEGETIFFGGVRKGEQGTPVVLWKPIRKTGVDSDGNERDDSYLLLRYFTVFNVEQCEGVPAPATEPLPEFVPIERAQEIADTMPQRPSVRHGGDRAFYSPTLDYVQMPLQGAFETPEAYYGVLFHELAHSTGHASRLNREGIEAAGTTFGDEVYSREELVAEIASAIVSAEAGIEPNIPRSAAYVKSWLKYAKDNRSEILKAAAQAQKAADFIIKHEAA